MASNLDCDMQGDRESVVLPPQASSECTDAAAGKPVRWVSASTVRYYEATLQTNLFGDWEVLTVWGAIASPLGGHQCLPVGDAAAGLAMLVTIDDRRVRRGYVATGNR